MVELAEKAEANAKAEEKAKIEAEYQQKVKEADAFFIDGELESAKTAYQEALAIKDEFYPKDQLEEIDRLKTEASK